MVATTTAAAMTATTTTRAAASAAMTAPCPTTVESTAHAASTMESTTADRPRREGGGLMTLDGRSAVTSDNRAICRHARHGRGAARTHHGSDALLSAGGEPLHACARGCDVRSAAEARAPGLM